MSKAAEIYLRALLNAENGNGLKVIDYAHVHNHLGHTFTCSYKSPEGSDVADNASIVVALVVGALQPHMIFAFAGGGDTELVLTEGAVLSANGSVLRLVNKKRDSGVTPESRAYLAPSVTGAGLQIFHLLAPGGVTGQAAGGSADHDSEWLLKTNTTYLFTVTNRAGSAKPISIRIEFYEHPAAEADAY